MMLEASLEDTINMNGLETSGTHLSDECIKMIFGLKLVPGGQTQITSETLHKGWIMIWCFFLDATQLES